MSSKWQSPAVLDDVLDSCICINIRRAARQVTQLYDDELRKSGLLSTQLPVLVAVTLLGPVDVKTLAERLDMDQTTISRNLKPLVRENWIIVSSGDDRRTRIITVTKAGRKKLDKVLPVWEKTQRSLEEIIYSPYLFNLFSDVLESAKSLRKK